MHACMRLVHPCTFGRRGWRPGALGVPREGQPFICGRLHSSSRVHAMPCVDTPPPVKPFKPRLWKWPLTQVATPTICAVRRTCFDAPRMHAWMHACVRARTCSSRAS